MATYSDLITTILDGSITAPKLNGAQTGSAPIYGCRAWVNFNGTGIVSIRASGNVSSIIDNGVGDWTVNFTTAMPDANYSIGGLGSGAFGVINNAYTLFAISLSSASFRCGALNSGASAAADGANISIQIFR
jgi:hypothetical protein